jgi:hypothetical protein
VLKSHYQKLIIAGNAIRDAEERYYLVYSEYTDNLENLDISINIIDPQIRLTITDGKNDSNYARVSVSRGDFSRSALAYVVAFSKDRMEANRKDCLARKDDDLAIKVCMEITGNTSISAQWSPDIYRFRFK